MILLKDNKDLKVYIIQQLKKIKIIDFQHRITLQIKMKKKNYHEKCSNNRINSISQQKIAIMCQIVIYSFLTVISQYNKISQVSEEGLIFQTIKQIRTKLIIEKFNLKN